MWIFDNQSLLRLRVRGFFDLYLEHKVKPFIKLVSFLLIMLTITTGCAEDAVTSGKIEKLIGETLEVGDSSLEIESFLKQNEITFAFDRFNVRYQGLINDPSKYKPEGYHSIVIYIYVDENKAFKRAEVRDSYTII